MVTQVDDEDYLWLSRFRWWSSGAGDKIYVYGSPLVGFQEIGMHRYIMGVADGKIKVDHKDGNTLNNQKSNLRRCNHRENNLNKPGHKDGSSKYKGVHFASKKWVGNIYIDGKRVYLGRFELEEDAARAYNKVASEHFGDFAWLNDV